MQLWYIRIYPNAYNIRMLVIPIDNYMLKYDKKPYTILLHTVLTTCTQVLLDVYDIYIIIIAAAHVLC